MGFLIGPEPSDMMHTWNCEAIPVTHNKDSLEYHMTSKTKSTKHEKKSHESISIRS